MRSAWVAERGPAESIRDSDLPMPEVGPNDLLVRVEAVAIDPVDTLVRSGRYQTPLPFPFIVGRDLVGTVERVGAETRDFTVGDRVWSNSLGHAGRQGATAEFVSVPADRAYPLPEGVDAVRAAAVLHPLATAHLALFAHGGLVADAPDASAPARADDRPSSTVQAGAASLPVAPGPAASPPPTVVVAGAAGNVGSAVVALAAAAAARVVATASAADAVYVTALGASAVVDYHAPDWLERLISLTPEGAALAIDTSGSLGVEWALSCLRPRGVVVVMAGFGKTFPLPLGPLYARDITLAGFAISSATVAELMDAASTVNRTLASTDFSARTVEVIGFDGVAAAHARIERGEAGSTRYVVVP